MAREKTVFRAQAGFQEQLLMTDKVNFVIAGSGAGVGKTWVELFSILRHTWVQDFYGVVFRKTYQQIFSSIIPQAEKLYSGVNYNKFVKSPHPQWVFYNDAKKQKKRSRIQFAQMLYESDKEKFQGAEIDRVVFDEITHFLRSQVFYLFSRLRSQTDVTPQLLGTCNPDPDSFVLELLDAGKYLLADGFADPSMAGVVQWMVHIDGEYLFSPLSQKDKLWEKTGIEPMSFTFLPGSIEDNKIMLEKNSMFKAMLEGLPEYEKMMLLHGCWRASKNNGLIKSRMIHSYFEDDIGAVIPIVSKAIFVDTSYKASEKNDWNVFLCGGRASDGRLFVLDVLRFKTNDPIELYNKAEQFYLKHSKGDYTILDFETGKMKFFNPPSFLGAFIEDTGRGSDLLFRLKVEKGFKVGPIRRSGDIGKIKKSDYGNRGNDKVSRLVSVLPILEKSGLHLPSTSGTRWTGMDSWCDPSVKTDPKKWIPDYKAEILAFGVDENGKISVSHDDQVDVTTDFVTFMGGDGNQGARWLNQMLNMGREIGS